MFRRQVWLSMLLAALASAGCADKMVTLQYAPDPSFTPLNSAQSITVFQFADRRGSEGDRDLYRVGGVYGGYGNRLAKVMTGTPWPRTLALALTAGFKARGIEAVAVGDREFTLGTAFTTLLALAGEIRNLSTESRWSTSAHISGIVRLYDAKGGVLVEKTISERETWGLGAGVLMSTEPLEETLNKALVGFVRKVVNDPDIIETLLAR